MLTVLGYIHAWYLMYNAIYMLMLQVSVGDVDGVCIVACVLLLLVQCTTRHRLTRT